MKSINNILVIGSNGFIGSHVLQYFKNLNSYKVYGCDINESTLENYFQVDNNFSEYDSILLKATPDVCIFCAGSGSVPLSIQDPEMDRMRNVHTVERVLKAIVDLKIACKFIHLSSAAVYGNPVSLPVSEGQPLEPLSPYGKHKIEAEQLCFYYASKFGLKTINTRIFSAYGDGLTKQLFWDLYQKSKLGNTIELFGSGLESRDFIYVTDVAHAINCVMQKAEFKGESVNLANGNEISIRDAAQVFLSLLGFKGELKFTQNQRKGDPSNWVANIDKLKRMGYVQQVTFDQGIKNYIDWLRKEKK